MRKTRRVLCSMSVVLGGAVMLQASAMAGDIYVSNPMPPDNDVNDSICTFREAIQELAFGGGGYHGCKGANGQNDTIHLPAGTYTFASTPPEVALPVTIVGSGASRTTINGNGKGALYIVSGYEEIDDVTVTGFTNSSAIIVAGGGELGINHVVFLNNGGSTIGGGDIDNYNYVYVFGSSFQTTTNQFSGVIRNEVSASFTLDSSTISGGSSEHGIIYNAQGSMWILNSTIGANTDTASGVIHNDAGSSLTVQLSTITYNKSQGRVATAIYSSGSTTTVTASLIFGNGLNSGGPTCVGATSGGYNVFDQAEPCAALTTGDATTSAPQLDTSSPSYLPKAHGGLGPVYLPLAGSPLLNHVPDVEGFCEVIDQRGANKYNGDAGVCTAGSVDVPTAVLVVGNPNALTNGDSNVLNQLRALLGTNAVSVVADTWNSTPPDGVPIVVAGSVNDAHVGTHFRNTTAAVVILKQSLYDEMYMTNSSSNEGTTNSTTLRLNGGIPSRAGYSSGGYNGGNDLTVTSSSQAYGWASNLSSTAPTIQATIPANGNAALFYYNPNQTMFHSFYAPFWRFGLFATDAAAAALNTAGNRVLQETVLAAMNPD